MMNLYKYIPPPEYITKQFRSVLWYLRQSECCVCYEFTEEPFKTKCNHTICPECSDKTKEQGLDTCPVCVAETFSANENSKFIFIDSIPYLVTFRLSDHHLNQ